MLPSIWRIILWQPAISMIIEQVKHIEKQFEAACKADIEAIKPGNVSVYSSGHQMRSDDFIKSADACATAICTPHYGLGERILHAVQETRRVVPMNTNLGIILLCAPLIQAIYSDSEQPLRECLGHVLAQTTVDDARRAYQAIRLAEAGGLGQVKHADIGTEPDISLLEAMKLAQRRDLIAAQYANDYRDIFEHAYPALLAFYSKWGYNRSAVSGVYMKLLASYPDSLIIRKWGEAVAREVCKLASTLYERYCRGNEPGDFDIKLLELDRKLKQRGINPGTTADLTVATIFLAGLDNTT